MGVQKNGQRLGGVSQGVPLSFLPLVIVTQCFKAWPLFSSHRKDRRICKYAISGRRRLDGIFRCCSDVPLAHGTDQRQFWVLTSAK